MHEYLRDDLIFLAHRFSVFFSSILILYTMLDHFNLVHNSGMHEYLRDCLIFLKCATRDWLNHAYPRPALESIARYRTATDRPAPPFDSHSVTITLQRRYSPTVTPSLTSPRSRSSK